jgi:hypothetical protein
MQRQWHWTSDLAGRACTAARQHQRCTCQRRRLRTPQPQPHPLPRCSAPPGTARRPRWRSWRSCLRGRPRRRQRQWRCQRRLAPRCPPPQRRRQGCPGHWLPGLGRRARRLGSQRRWHSAQARRARTATLPPPTPCQLRRGCRRQCSEPPGCHWRARGGRARRTSCLLRSRCRQGRQCRRCRRPLPAQQHRPRRGGRGRAGRSRAGRARTLQCARWWQCSPHRRPGRRRQRRHPPRRWPCRQGRTGTWRGRLRQLPRCTCPVGTAGRLGRRRQA